MRMNRPKPDRQQALRVARLIGCSGAHETENGWMPCGSHDKLVEVSMAAEKKDDAGRNVFATLPEALRAARACGARKVRVLKIDGRDVFVPEKPERLAERPRPVGSITDVAGVGIVGKEDT